MESTLMTGDIIVYNRLAYKLHSPQRGDVTIFKLFNTEAGEFQNVTKRVIGIAGDEIEFRDGYVYLNGKQYDENKYLDVDTETNSLKIFTVPENSLFVLGDNREHSHDSRYWDDPFIPITDVKGKLLFRIPSRTKAEAPADSEAPEQSARTTSVKSKWKLSSPDAPLALGETGGCMVLNENGEYVADAVRIDTIYIDDDAQDILRRNHIENEPATGTRFQVAEYTVLKDPAKYYLNIKFTGMDGKRLEFQGSSYTTRTFDITAEIIKTKDGYAKLYVYYEVPIDCKEYELVCGIAIDNKETTAVFQP